MDEIDWYKWDDDKKSYVFNHRERDGSMHLNAPIPKSDIQKKAWANARWYKELVLEEPPCQ
jgi:hypothetical protein